MTKRKTRADGRDERRRRRVDNALTREYKQNERNRFDVKLYRIRSITDDEWAKAVEADEEEEEINSLGRRSPFMDISDLSLTVSFARDWETPIEDAANVIKLIHLAARMDSFDAEEIRSNLLKMSRRAYEEELTIQARRAGCPTRVGRLNNNSILSELNQDVLQDALSIVNTYNYDLLVEIERIRAETPRANRHTYAARLKTWKEGRSKWKDKQVSQYTTGKARSKAQADFRYYNNISGVAVLRPRKAVCPVCKGWINRGDVPLRVATNSPPPYHTNCPHYWAVYPERVPKEECVNLWMGE